MFHPKIRKYAGERLATDQLDRRARAVRLAQETFDTIPDALAFLNTQNEGIGGRPLDLAIASPAGLEAVEGVLMHIAAHTPARSMPSQRHS